ncbi:MAG: pentapeptide repeat-containing protein, partial [Okeania sp. SIO2D1]|nr:pentapeptide repeat-containing protein [Okeania sp. SIO2D1]
MSVNTGEKNMNSDELIQRYQAGERDFSGVELEDIEL